MRREAHCPDKPDKQDGRCDGEWGKNLSLEAGVPAKKEKSAGEESEQNPYTEEDWKDLIGTT